MHRIHRLIVDDDSADKERKEQTEQRHDHRKQEHVL
jgi:hypothetical protein